MFPDSPYAVPRGSFERPVPLVLVDPCSEPTVTVRINREWIPYILGALQQLVLQATWKTDDPDALWLVQQRAMLLLSCVGVSLDNPDCECGCADYAPSADIISWAPENPFTDPENVPAGYRFPPWYVVGGSIPFTGLQAGDVLTDLLHGPIVEPVSSGFPRLRLTCSGTGTVQITFVRFPTAGVALITVDGQVGTAKFIDLHMSLAASIGTADGEMIIPFEITTPGDHFIDITMLYSITEAPPFVHFGGAVRQVALCGFGVSPRPIPITQFVELMGDDMPICTQLRWNNGVLQGLCCVDPATGLMTWEDIPGSAGTIQQGGAQPAPENRPTPAQSKCYSVKLDGNGQWLLPFGVSENDIITISNVKGGWSDGTVYWKCATGGAYGGGDCFGGCTHAVGDPSATACHMELIGVYIDGTTFALSDSPITVPSGFAGVQVAFQANDGTLGDNRGSITFDVCVQSGSPLPTSTWCHVLDFKVSDFGFVAGPAYGAVWTSGTGWHSSDIGIFLEKALPFGAHLTYAKITFDTDGTNHGGSCSYQQLELADRTPGGGSTSWFNDCANAYAGQPPTEHTSDFTVAAGHNLELDSVNTDATFWTISAIELHGTGDDPFGVSNC